MTYFMDKRPPRKPHLHRVYMHVMLRHGYHISFLEEDLKTSLKKKLTFASLDKVWEMYDRWAEDKSEEDKEDHMLEFEMGRPSGFFLILSEEQYRKLQE